MKERPIIFNSDMVLALLEGRKTQTRRPIKPQPVIAPGIGEVWKGSDWLEEWIKMSPYSVGLRLWVRETWKPVTTFKGGGIPRMGIRWGEGWIWRAGNPDQTGPWKPAIYMPRKMSRITLEIINIGVKRVRDISEEDGKAEGVLPSETVQMKDGSPCYSLPFQILWGNTYGVDNPFAWESNPWVWVIEFKKL